MKRIIFIALLIFIAFGTPASLADHSCVDPGGKTVDGKHYGVGNGPSPKSPYSAQGDRVPCTIIGAIAKDIGYDLTDIFGWAVGLGSIVALGVITYGGTRYAASGLFGAHSSESQIHEAKEWIWAGLKGLALLIAAYLILNTINPNILVF